MFPMKFFEYLAAGLPVVATAIDALGQFADASLLCAPEPEAFATALEEGSRGSRSGSDDPSCACGAAHLQPNPADAGRARGGRMTGRP